MTTPIIIETTTTTRERLVLVPVDACSEVREGDPRAKLGAKVGLTVLGTYARDATAADLERAGWVREMVEPTGPGTLAHLRADLRDMTARAEKAEATLAMHGRPTYVEAVERAEKAERERDDLLARINQAEHEARCRGAEAKELVRVLEVERDEAKRLHSEAEAQVACRSELRAQVASLRAELARLTAPGEGEPTVSWFYDTYCARFESTQQEDCADAYRLGVAHERARHVEKDRATDEELGRVFGEAYTVEESPDHGVALRTAYLAVAAHVRQERCLIAQAVAADCDVHVTEQISGGWCVRVVAQTSSTAAGVSATVPRADAPSTLARLLGEVARG